MERSWKGASCLTDSLFFDSDCISAFLWVGNEALLTKLYPGKIVIPKPVYEELSYPGIAHLKARIDALLTTNQARIGAISTDTDTYELYYRLTMCPEKGYMVIGKGEAASIALAKTYNGIVASNNLRDICVYVEKYALRHITTGDIMLEALKKELITEAQGDQIWASMLAKRRRLGAASFSEYIEKKDSV